MAEVKVTKAQLFYLKLGAAHELVLLGHRKGKLPSFTKKGPGRRPAHRKDFV
jgi:hypothetical protein